MCLMAAFVPHRPNKSFHVTASNGIVSSSPDTPLAIMTASPIASVRVFETSAMQMSSRYGRCAPNAVDDRTRDHHLTDHRFWGHASGPSSSGKTLNRSIHCWHGHAARRSALPRERFSPLAHLRHADRIEQCPSLSAKRKTYTRTEFFSLCEGLRMPAP